MIFHAGSESQTTTSYKVVLPFYGYAALSFVVLCVMLFFFSGSFGGHYFQPPILAVTHIATLGWGTMMILGAGYQLIPVLIEAKLYSNLLAYLTFIFVGAGIPLLVYAFAIFDVGILMQVGAILINAGLLFFLLNVFISINKSKKENVHAIFIFTATSWLWLTTLLGLFLVYNFSVPIFSSDSLHYLPLHAHMGIVGWFLLLIIGVSSRLIPLFMISKYESPKLLWWIYGLINTGLLLFLADTFFYGLNLRTIVYVGFIVAGIILFARYCYNAYQKRIRNKIDGQIKTSLLSVVMLFIPASTIVSLIIYFFIKQQWSTDFILLYGFAIFMGWITAIILGMTFKTLPFIMWNKVYQKVAGRAGNPAPKELFSESVFNITMIVYILAFVFCCIGIAFNLNLVFKGGAFLFVACSVLYGLNVCKIFLHKPKIKI